MKKLALLTCSAASGLLLFTGTATAGGDKTIKTIEGAWEVQETARWESEDCTSGEIISFGPNPFPALQTFHKGGTMNDYNARTSPSERTVGFGVWEKTGKGEFTSHHKALGFDSNGLLNAKIDGRSNITLTGNGYTYTGVSRVKLEDLSGNVLNICVTMEGTRLPL